MRGFGGGPTCSIFWGIVGGRRGFGGLSLGLSRAESLGVQWRLAEGAGPQRPAWEEGALRRRLSEKTLGGTGAAGGAMSRSPQP